MGTGAEDMSTPQQPEALRSLYDITGNITDVNTMLIGQDALNSMQAENEALRAERDRNLNSIRVNNEIINKKLDENETLRAGYAAARLEIESLRAEQPAGAQQPGDERAAFEQWSKVTNQGYDLARNVSGKLQTFESTETEHAWRGFFHGLRASHGQAPASLQSGEQPLPLLVKDIAADLATTPIQVCMALSVLGFGAHSVNMAVTPTMAQALRAHFSATEQAAPAAVAGPSESVKFMDQSTADPVEKARRYLTAMGDQRTNSAYFYDDGYPRRESAQDALATLAVLEQLAAAPAAPAAQPAPQQEAQEPVAWYVTGCGRLLDEYDAEAEARRIGGTAKAMPLYTVPQPSPASQGDALDAARYRWLRDVSVPPHNFYLSVPDEFKDVKFSKAEVDSAIDAARAAQEGK